MKIIKGWPFLLFLMLTTACYALGITLPILELDKIFGLFSNEQSVLSGVALLAENNEWLLFVIIVVFSICFPVTKMVLLFWLAHLYYRRGIHRLKIHHRLEAMGKWSMVDVFVVAQLVVFVKLGDLADIEAKPGVYFFCISVLMTMAASWWMGRLYRTIDGSP